MNRRTVIKGSVAMAALLPLVSLSGIASARSRGSVLVVLSSEDRLELREGKTYRTGFYLNELVIPVQKLIAAGYTPVFANPKGNKPSLDARSNDRSYFGNDEAVRVAAQRFVDGREDLQRPKSLSTVLTEGLDVYAGIFVPGGHAPMQDLLRDAQMGQILRHFHVTEKPTALICHGPIALLAAIQDAEGFHQALIRDDDAALTEISAEWIYKGYRMAAFSTPEERFAEAGQLGGRVLFYPSEALAAAGAKVETGAKWRSQVVRDRELITGQQPSSDDALGEMFVRALDASLALH